MKCGHSRNLFYVSRSYFSFYLHTFLTHLNKWNTRWDFIFIRHLKTTCGWQRRPAGRQRWRRCATAVDQDNAVTLVRELSYRPVTSVLAAISEVRELSYTCDCIGLCLIIVCVGMDLVLYRCVRFGCLCDLHRVHVLNTHLWHINGGLFCTTE